MNKKECKKYIKKACNKMIQQSKEMTPENLSKEMEKLICDEAIVYISYGMIAMHNLNKSANDITSKELVKQIDEITKIYSQNQVLLKAGELKINRTIYN